VLLRTVILENECRQSELRDEALAELERALSVLQKWGVAVPPFDDEDLIPRINLIACLQSTGITGTPNAVRLFTYRPKPLTRRVTKCEIS
jgi:hypothetical protein